MPVQQEPGNGDCWAMLSLMYSNEFGHWDIRDPATFEKALRAARTAVLSAPLHSLPHYAHKALQQTLSLKPDYGKVARQLHGKWIQPELVEQLMEGLRKAGLEIAWDEAPP